MSKTLYMAVTPDEYELPMMVTDNIREIAKAYGKSVNTISVSICQDISGKKAGVKFVKVNIDE